MSGPHRAIVGGQARYKWSFPPAAWIRVDNNSTQYFKLDELDDYVVPGQVNKFINVDGLSSVTGIFTAPPGVTQAAPTQGQIAQVWTYDVGAEGGPLSASPGLLLPIGLDSPQHLHHHAATHVHDISAASHFHNHTATHLHAHTATHVHAISTAGVSNTGSSDGTVGFHTHTYLDVTGNNTDAAAPGNTNAAAPGNTNSVSFGNTAAATPGDSDLENVQHTHP